MKIVYFLRAGSLVKIGTTRDIMKRVIDIQHMNHDKLELVAIDSRDRERELHEKFSRHRSHGEWFWWCKEIEDEAMGCSHAERQEVDRVNRRLARVFWRPRSVLKREIVQELANEKKKLERLRETHAPFPPGLSAKDGIRRWRGRWAVSIGRLPNRIATSFPLDTPVDVMRQWQKAPLRNKRGKGIPYPDAATVSENTSLVPQPAS